MPYDINARYTENGDLDPRPVVFDLHAHTSDPDLAVDDFIAGRIFLAQAHAREQVGIRGRRHEMRAVRATEVPHGQAEMEERTATTDHELAISRVRHPQGPGPVRVELDLIPVHLEEPRLRIVVRGREHGIAKEKPQFLRGRTQARKLILAHFPC